MLFKDISILDEDFDYQTHKWVGVKDGRIAYIGDEAPIDANAYGEVYDGTDRLMMPAMYNAHAHAPMTLLRGYAENATLHDWLNKLVWPFEAKITAEDYHSATLLSCAEMARYGVVGFSDMYFRAEQRAEAIIEAGLKANLADGVIAFDPNKPYSDYDAFQVYETMLPKLHGADEGRILMDQTIHAEYTTVDPVVRDIIAYAKEHDLGVQVHISETQSEHEECKGRKNGMTPVQYFESVGLFDVRTVAAHCVWVDDADMAIMKEHGVFVASNPASNLKLGSGFAPIPEMLARGLNVCIGTDGMASNNNHDMFQDMYLFAMVHKGKGDPTVVTPKEAIRAATRMGALAQGREDCGLIKVGFKADLAVLDTSGPSWWPMTDPACNLVYAGHGSDVVLTMCDGRVVYRDGEWPRIDIERVKAEVSARTKRIISEL
ncbi:MAG: amidohydrolase [Eggerthellaceae bacterium]|nr:amidohydrolase [Eggerthellaceae bacterium]